MRLSASEIAAPKSTASCCVNLHNILNAVMMTEKKTIPPILDGQNSLRWIVSVLIFFKHESFFFCLPSFEWKQTGWHSIIMGATKSCDVYEKELGCKLVVSFRVHAISAFTMLLSQSSR